MGNKLCKKKTDVTDNPKSPTPFDRIINRLHLRPNSWKSDSHLNQKQVNRSAVNNSEGKNIKEVQPLSKSSDWTDVALEVPEESIHLRNPRLSLMFDNDNNTPTPPPRKHKKSFHEKLEAIAKNGLQALQIKKPVEEPLFVKKTIQQTCPLDDHDCAIHNRNHKHDLKKHELSEAEKEERLKRIEDEAKLSEKKSKRRKNLSVVSLPNYNELKLTVANFDDIDKKPDIVKSSLVDLPNESKKLSSASTGKLETCMTRCRSFGSLLPQQLLDKLRVRKVPADIESDDSFGGLEDWDLRIIEHYNPKDASLPRPRKLSTKTNKEVLSNVENLIVKDEDEEKVTAPPRRSESLLKKLNREASKSAATCRNFIKKSTDCEQNSTGTPPPTPEQRIIDNNQMKSLNAAPTEDDKEIEHSSLMKILEEFSMKNSSENEKVSKIEEAKSNNVSNHSSVISPGVEFQKKINSVENFLHNEKLSVHRDIQHSQLGNLNMTKT